MKEKEMEIEEVWDELRQQWRPVDAVPPVEEGNYTMGILAPASDEPLAPGGTPEPYYNEHTTGYIPPAAPTAPGPVHPEPQRPAPPPTLMGLSDPNVPQPPHWQSYPPVMEKPAWEGGQGTAREDNFVRVDRYTGPALKGVAGDLAGRLISIRGIMTLGRDPACDIPLAMGAVGVSRKHLRFWMDGIRIHTMDLASTNGTTLNGVQMKPGLVYTLAQGDVLRFGAQEELRVV